MVQRGDAWFNPGVNSLGINEFSNTSVETLDAAEFTWSNENSASATDTDRWIGGLLNLGWAEYIS